MAFWETELSIGPFLIVLFSFVFPKNGQFNVAISYFDKVNLSFIENDNKNNYLSFTLHFLNGFQRIKFNPTCILVNVRRG